MFRHAAKKLAHFLFSNWFLLVSFAFIFRCFLKCWLLYIIQEWKFSVLSPEVNELRLVSPIQFSLLLLGILSHGKEVI